MIRDRVSLAPGREFSSREVNRNRIMFTESRYTRSCLFSGLCLVKGVVQKVRKNFNGEEIARLFLATAAGDEHHKTTALSGVLNS